MTTMLHNKQGSEMNKNVFFQSSLLLFVLAISSINLQKRASNTSMDVSHARI